jgi:hypothetical protein
MGVRNKFEKKIYQQLKRSKVPFKYESEKIPYVLAGHYIPDFIIVSPFGRIYIETKGYLRPEAKRKLIAVKRQHPEMDIRLLFYAKRPAQIRWADKAGFRWAIGTIPKEWLDGF